MPIDIRCPQCKSKIRVADRHAGKKAKCPKCQGPITIPSASDTVPPQPNEQVAAMPTPLPQPQAATPTPAPQPAGGSWFVKTEEGEEYGPITRQELNQWTAEGRVDASTQLLQEGWDQWKWAEDVYPELAPQQAAQTPVPTATPSATPGVVPVAAPTAGAQANPFEAPAVAPGGPVYDTSSADQGGGLTSRSVQALAQTKPWVIFLSILGFIGGGFMGLYALIMAFGAIAAISQVGGIGAILLLFALLFAAGAAIYIYASYQLLTYGTSIGRFQITKDPHVLEKALIAQKSFWKLVGIVTAVYLISIPVLWILMLLLGGLGAMM